MTSAWKERPDGNDRAEGASVESDENQLEMFDNVPLGGPDPRMADSAHGGDPHEGGARQRTDVAVSDASPLRFLDISGADPDELRRLEESIRWLMNEGNNVRQLPRAATLPPVRGLPPVEVNESADPLLLNPDRLFTPRVSHRGGGVTRGVAKFLLASAVAAPTAYFVANWLQRADTATPPHAAAVVGSLEERVAAAAPTPIASRSERGRVAEAAAPQAEPMVTRGLPPMEVKPATAVEANAVEPAAAPERPPSAAAVTPDPAPANVIAASSPPPSVVAQRPVLSAQDIADLVERGRTLFESGDVAAARLFFRRAANAGNAAAALAMGATYDPDVLAKRFVRGIGADAEAARMWYEKARELGSPDGSRRIEMLAHR